MKSAAVKDENGNVCTTLEAQGERLEEELERVTQRSPRPELADVPSEEEVWKKRCAVQLGSSEMGRLVVHLAFFQR